MRWQVFPVGVVLIALNSWWVMLGSEVWHSTQLTIASLFFNAVFALFLLVIGGGALRRIAPRLAPTRAEILVLYVMVVILTTISGHTMMGYLLPAMEHVYWFASPENDWPALFGHHLPGWLVVKDRDALRGYFEGDASLYTPRAMRAWAAPALAWTGIIVVLWTVLMLTTILLRRQWTEHEKLSYPVTQLPLALTADPVQFFRSRWMWAGFGLIAVLDIWNGVAFLHPVMPSLPIKNHRVATFTMGPWRALGTVWVSFYPFVIGLMYFTPLDLSFSCWFFYVLGRLWGVAVVAAGHSAAYVMQLAGHRPAAWSRIALIAPTWRGPLPTVLGCHRWLLALPRHLLQLPLLGEGLYRLSVMPTVLARMYRSHVYGNPDGVTQRLIAEKGLIARQRFARYASAAFFTGALDAVHTRTEFLGLVDHLLVPLLAVCGSQTPTRSWQEMAALCTRSDVLVNRVPGALAPHEEHPAPVSRAVVDFLLSGQSTL